MSTDIEVIQQHYIDERWLKANFDDVNYAVRQALISNQVNDSGLETLILIFPRILMIDPVASGHVLYDAIRAYKHEAPVSYLTNSAPEVEAMFLSNQHQNYKQYDNRSLLRAYIALFRVLVYRLDTPSTHFIESAQLLANKIGDVATKSELKLAIAILYTRYGKPELATRAINLATSAYSRFQQVKNYRLMAQAAWAIGVSNRVINNHEEAIHWLNIAEKFTPESDLRAMATIRLEKGNIFFMNGLRDQKAGHESVARLNLHRAKRTFEDMITELEQEDYDGKFGAFESLALTLSAMGKFEESQKYYQIILDEGNNRSVVVLVRTINNYIWSLGTQLDRNKISKQIRAEKHALVIKLADLAEELISNFHDESLTDIEKVRLSKKWIKDNL